MPVSFNASYWGAIRAEETSEDNDGWGIAKSISELEIAGKDDDDNTDKSAVLSVKSVLTQQQTASGDDFCVVTVRDEDARPNLKIEINDDGDVTVENPGKTGSASYTMEAALPHEVAIEQARRAVKKAEAKGPIVAVEIDYGTDWSEPYGKIDIENE